MKSLQRLFFFIAFFSIYGAANYYIALRIYQWLTLSFAGINAKIYISLYVFVALSYIFATLSRRIKSVTIPISIRKIMNLIGAYWLGIFIYLLIFIFLADIAPLLGIATGIIPSPLTNHMLFYRGLVALLLSVGIVSYGIYNAVQIRLVSYEVQLSKSILSNEIKIALISDLHLGAINSERNLEKIVQGINSLEPDIVCIAGDIFNDNIYAIRDRDRAATLFREIDSKYGIFACLGNHDSGSTFHQKIRLLEESNITLLNDEPVIIGERLVLLGRLDSGPIGYFGGLERRDVSNVIASMCADMPVIVMEHNPAHVGEYGSEVSLILAGHTHGGQMFPITLIVKAMHPFYHGHYQREGAHPNVIVTSGASTWGPPMRVGTNNEIVSILLR